MKAYFFNIGQGSCTAITRSNEPNPKNIIYTNHVWFVDAGTTSPTYNPLDLVLLEEFDKDHIAKAIAKEVCKNFPQVVHFLLSHQDEDHYKIIPNLIKHMKTDSPTVTKFIIYRRNAYQHKKVEDKDHKEDADDKKNNKDNIEILADEKTTLYHIKEDEYYLDWDGSKGDINSPIWILNPGTEFFTGHNEENHNSLLIKFRLGNDPNQDPSILLTGDATNFTYNGGRHEEENKRLNKTIEDESFKATLFQISHHGAETDESTSKPLLDKVQPLICVCSSGLYSKYYHPRQEVIDIVVEYFQDRDPPLPLDKFCFLTSNHNCDHAGFQSRDPRFTELGILESKPVTKPKTFKANKTIYATQYPIYHTASHGTLVFEFTAKNLQPKLTAWKYQSTSDAKEPIKFVNHQFLFKKQDLVGEFVKLVESFNNTSRKTTSKFLALNVISDINYIEDLLKKKKSLFELIKTLDLQIFKANIQWNIFEAAVKDYPQLTRVVVDVSGEPKNTQEKILTKFYKKPSEPKKKKYKY